MTLPALTLYLFGPLRIEQNGAAVVSRRRKAQALLAYLAVTGQSHSRDALATLLWPEFNQNQARTNLRRELAELRGLLGGARLLDDRVTVALNTAPPFALDLATFQQHLAQARQCPHPGLPAGADLCPACLPHLSQAAALYTDDFLAGFTLPDSPAFDDWHFFQADGLRQTLAQLLERLVQGHHAAQQFTEAIPFARRWVALDPLHERAHCQLMLVYELAGQRAAARRQYESCVRALEEELGVPPAAETTALYEQIRLDEFTHQRGNRAYIEPQTGEPPPPLELPTFLTRTNTAVERTPEVVVAREQELAQLQQALVNAKAGKSRPLFIVGDAGQGKTTLLEEFTRRALADDAELLIMSGHGNAYTGIGDPYLPFRSALSLLLGDVASAVAGGRLTLPHARRLWEAMPITLPLLAEHAPNLAGNFVAGPALLARAAPVAGNQRGWLTRLEQATAASVTTQMKQQQIFEQVTTLLQATAAQRPLVLILEDLHWSDASSVSLLFHLCRQIDTDPILIVGSYRPNEVAAGWDNQPHPLAGVLAELKRHYGDIWIDLTNIDMQRGRAFVDAYLDTQPNRLAEPFRRALFACTAGHPLFTVELFHALQARGDVQVDTEGRWVAAQCIDWDKVPTKVEGVIEGRLAALDHELQHALQIASVEGESFTAEVTARIQHVDIRQLVQRFSGEVSQQQHLIRGEGLKQIGEQRLSIYRFRHQLFQKYLYQGLDEATRAYLHEAVGKALETLYGPQKELIAGELAWHFRLAGFIPQAIAYLQIAAQTAIHNSAYLEGINHLRMALALLARLPQTTDRDQQELSLQVALGQALIVTQGFASPEVVQGVPLVRELFRRVENNPKFFPVLYGLSNYHFIQAEHQMARELAEQFMTLAQRQAEVTLLLVAHKLLGAILMHIGELPAAQLHLEQAISLYDKQQHYDLVLRYGGEDVGVNSCNKLAQTLWLLGYPARALQWQKKALALAMSLRHPLSLAAMRVAAAWLHLLRGEVQAAKTEAEAVLQLSPEQNFPAWLPWAALIAGYALSQTTVSNEGLMKMRLGLAEMRGDKSTLLRPQHLLMLAMAYGKTQQVEQGLAFLAEALLFIDKTGERMMEAEAYRVKGELLLFQHNAETEAEAAYHQAIQIAQQQAAKSWELRATMSLCRLWQKQGKQTAAQQRLAAIVGWFTEGFDTADLIAAKALLATLA